MHNTSHLEQKTSLVGPAVSEVQVGDKLDNRGLKNPQTLSFSWDSCMIGSKFDVNNMKA